MPFTALSPDRSTRFVLPGATRYEQDVPGAVLLTGLDDRVTDVICPDAHCDGARLFYRQGTDRRPHWAHMPGTGAACGYEGGMSEWHTRVQLRVLMHAAGHEHRIPGARADAVIDVPSSDGPQLIAVEVQTSRIDPETVRRRHRAHAAAGLAATVWIVNGEDTGLDENEDWEDARYDVLGTSFHRNVRGQRITQRWIVDLIRACMEDAEETGHPSSIGILAPPAHSPYTLFTGEDHLRFIERAAIVADSEGNRVAHVTRWSLPIAEPVMTVWSRGAARWDANSLPGGDYGPPLHALDAALTRTVQRETQAFHIAYRGTRVRIAFEVEDDDVRAVGESLGLTWKPGPWRSKDRRINVQAGILIGPVTPLVNDWLEADFGEERATEKQSRRITALYMALGGGRDRDSRKVARAFVDSAFRSAGRLDLTDVALVKDAATCLSRHGASTVIKRLTEHERAMQTRELVAAHRAA